MSMSETIHSPEMFRQAPENVRSRPGGATVPFTVWRTGARSSSPEEPPSVLRCSQGLFRVGDSTVIERTLAQAPEGPQFVNANRPEPYEFLGLPIVGDLVPGHGAPGAW